MLGSRVSFAAVIPVLVLLYGLPANAQAARTWVSGVGDDANPCSRTAPCKTFAGAISKTAAGGEINTIDNGAFGAVTITKSITINAEHNEAGVLATGTNGIVINAGANDVVVLRGLDIEGLGTGLNGIRFLAGAALHVQKCQVRNFRGASPNGNGLIFTPSSGTAELFVSDTIFINNGDPAGATGGAIAIQPTGSAISKVALNRVQMENNRIGIRAVSTVSTGKITVAINASTMVGNTNNGVAAVTAASGGVPIDMTVNNSVIMGNAFGVSASGSAATVRIGDSVIAANDAGVTIANNAVVQSYKTNMIDGNATNGTPLPAAALN